MHLLPRSSAPRRLTLVDPNLIRLPNTEVESMCPCSVCCCVQRSCFAANLSRPVKKSATFTGTFLLSRVYYLPLYPPWDSKTLISTWKPGQAMHSFRCGDQQAKQCLNYFLTCGKHNQGRWRNSGSQYFIFNLLCCSLDTGESEHGMLSQEPNRYSNQLICLTATALHSSESCGSCVAF